MNQPALSGYNACIEMLFAPEARDIVDRIALAADAGFDTVEFWGTPGKDIAAIGRAASKSGAMVGGFFVEPSMALADPANHPTFLAALTRDKQIALDLGAPFLGVVPGDALPGVPRNTQRIAIVECLRRAADLLADCGIVLLVEPINTGERKDGFVTTTPEGLAVVDAVARPEVKLVFDLYHSAVMGEDLVSVLAGKVDRVAHLHLADHPGRHEPGTGGIHWRDGLAWLRQNGYGGRVNLEYHPRAGTVAGLASIAAPERRRRTEPQP